MATRGHQHDTSGGDSEDDRQRHDHDAHDGHAHDDNHGHEHGGGLLGRLRQTFDHSHDHHAKVDDAMASNERGIWALKVSLAGLAATGIAQVFIYLLSGSTALLADTIHNFGDAATSVPLWIAFVLQRRERNRRFTYGYGRAEDIAGVIIVALILVSAIVAGYESIQKLLDPEPMTQLWFVAAAAIVGFVGNEAVAIYRIRVGRQIGSAALIADGQHSQVDGFTSLAVLIGVIGTAFGFPILDPLIGLAITVAILFIVRDAGRSVFRRLLDGIEPEILSEIERAPLRVPGVHEVHEVRARWLGHTVHADLHITVDPHLSVAESHDIVERVSDALSDLVPAFGGATIHVCPADPACAREPMPVQAGR